MIVVDTSVAIKWVVAEDRRVEAREILASGFLLEAPDLLMLEAANALRKKVRARQIGIDQMNAGIELIRESVGFQNTRVFFDEAMALSAELDHSIYDCWFLACVRRVMVPCWSRMMWLSLRNATQDSMAFTSLSSPRCPTVGWSRR